MTRLNNQMRFKNTKPIQIAEEMNQTFTRYKMKFTQSLRGDHVDLANKVLIKQNEIFKQDGKYLIF